MERPEDPCWLVSLSFPKNLETKSLVPALLQGSFLVGFRAAGGASLKKHELSCVQLLVAYL